MSKTPKAFIPSVQLSLSFCNVYIVIKPFKNQVQAIFRFGRNYTPNFFPYTLNFINGKPFFLFARTFSVFNKIFCSVKGADVFHD